MSTDQKEKTGQSSQTTVDQTQQENTTDNVTQQDDTQEAETSANRVARQDRQQEKSSDKLTRKEQKKKQKQEKRKQKKPRRRIFPIWLRTIVVLVLSAVALAAGLMVGYGLIGEGNPTDALKWETWQHIIDIVMKEE